MRDAEIARLRKENEMLKAQQPPAAQPKSQAGKSSLAKVADTKNVDEWDTKQLTLAPIDHQAWLKLVAPDQAPVESDMEEVSLDEWVKEEQEAWSVKELRKFSDQHLGGMKVHGRNQKIILLNLLAVAIKSKQSS